MPRQEFRRGSDARERIVKAIMEQRVSTTALPDRRHVKRYLQQYFAHVPYEDLEGRPESLMARAALDHLEFGKSRRKNQALLRVFNPSESKNGYESSFTFVEVINDDMPFLVNSLLAAISRRDLGIHMTIHPVLRVERDGRGRLKGIPAPSRSGGTTESWIRIAVDKETDPADLKALHDELERVLSDVRRAVTDWEAMRHKMEVACEDLEATDPGGAPDLKAESAELIRWLVDEHFTCLGYREYRLFERGQRTFLRSIKGSGLGLLASEDRGTKEIELTREMRRLARNKDWITITKANSRSTVHRYAYLDYIGIKIYDGSGRAVGEHRFIGLYTSVAYSESPRNIPLLRLKVDSVMQRNKVKPGGHRAKALMHILDTFPRDELFQASVGDLARTALGILNLQDRLRVRFFVRRDMFRRFLSCLVYVPREKYTTLVRRRIEKVLLEAFQGTGVDSSVQLSDSPLARVHIIVRTREVDRPKISIHRIERQIADIVVTWQDKLKEQLSLTFGEEVGLRLYRRYGHVFPAGYQEDTSPRDACSDVSRINSMRVAGTVRSVNLYRPVDCAPGHMHFIIYTNDEPLVLSLIHI